VYQLFESKFIKFDKYLIRRQFYKNYYSLINDIHQIIIQVQLLMPIGFIFTHFYPLQQNLELGNLIAINMVEIQSTSITLTWISRFLVRDCLIYVDFINPNLPKNVRLTSISFFSKLDAS
jgi:hypothetical protein